MADKPSWTDPVLEPYCSRIKAVHITELRNFTESIFDAVSEMYQEIYLGNEAVLNELAQSNHRRALGVK